MGWVMTYLVLVLALAQEGGRGPTADELEKRKQSLFKEAEEAQKKLKSWKGKLGVSESQVGKIFAGELWVKEGRLFLRRDDSRSLVQLASLDRTIEEDKIVQKYDLTVLRDFLPEGLIRDGLTKSLEERFEVTVVADARFMKLTGTADDWIQLGFKDEDDFENWKKKQKKDGYDEFDPFAKKRKEFEKDPPRTDAKASLYTELRLVPRDPDLARKIRDIFVRYRPGDYLPIYLVVNRPHSVFVMGFSELEKDVEIEDSVFRLDVPDYTVEYPQEKK